MSAVIFLIVCVGLTINLAFRGDEFTFHSLKYFLRYLIYFMILVLFIPEGLPLMVTLKLAYSINNCLKDGLLLRKLSALETLAYVSKIGLCKNGLLTKDRSIVMNIWNKSLRRIDAYSLRIE